MGPQEYGEDVRPVCQRFFADLKKLIEKFDILSERLHEGDLRFSRTEDHEERLDDLHKRLKEVEDFLTKLKFGLSIGGKSMKVVIGTNLIVTIILLIKSFNGS